MWSLRAVILSRSHGIDVFYYYGFTMCLGTANNITETGLGIMISIFRLGVTKTAYEVANQVPATSYGQERF